MKTTSKWLVKDSLGEEEVVDDEGVDAIHTAEKEGLRFVRFDTFMINVNFVVKIKQIKQEKYDHPADRPPEKLKELKELTEKEIEMIRFKVKAQIARSGIGKTPKT